MTALQYMGTGILFALVAGSCFVGAIVYFLLTKQKHYLYAERLGRMKFPEQFYKDMKEQYEKTEKHFTDARSSVGAISERKSSKTFTCI